MDFYGMLHAGSSRFITRKGNHNGVRVAAVIDRDGARGYIETVLDEHGRWQVTILSPPLHSGDPIVVATGDLTTATIEHGNA